MKVGTDILLCTFRRPHVVDTMRSLAALDPLPGPVRLIVVDNDDIPSAGEAVTACALKVPFPVIYIHAPARNISIARNAALDTATAPWVAMIDDDEIAPPDWLARLHARARQTGADAVFGPVEAIYADTAPKWMVMLDLHSTRPELRNGTLETGITGNALMRWAGTPWQDQRFDTARGRTGGEDTEFFFRLRRLGATYAPAPEAVLQESVPPSRLNTQWLRNRRFRMGQSYAAASATGPLARLSLFSTASAKCLYCTLRATLAPETASRMFWRLRGDLHRGVCAGLLGRREAELYGRTEGVEKG